MIMINSSHFTYKYIVTFLKADINKKTHKISPMGFTRYAIYYINMDYKVSLDVYGITVPPYMHVGLSPTLVI